MSLSLSKNKSRCGKSTEYQDITRIFCHKKQYKPHHKPFFVDHLIEKNNTIIMPLVKVWEVADGIEDEMAEEPTLSSSSGYYNIFSFYIVGEGTSYLLKP